jgi:hypothetical protein
MPEGSQPGPGWASDHGIFADHGIFHVPVWTLRLWSPLLSATIRSNLEVQEGLRTIASQWQAFVGSRLREDFALIQRVAHCSTPSQICGAYAEFWQKAAEDYGKEYTIMGRLVAEATRKCVAAAQSAAEEVTANAVRSSRIG